MMANGPLQLYLLFHLNLAYSSLEEIHRGKVIAQCYWPLLRLAEEFRVPIGIEATGFTLERIAEQDPLWVAKVRELMHAGLVEWVGSGYAQIIGPLAPAGINALNLQQGQATYERLLGLRPELALVNEQAYASGLLRHYRDAGFKAIAMEWDNPAASHPEWQRDWQYLPQYACNGAGEKMPLIWTHSIAFQQFQRYAHGEVSLERYLQFIDKQRGDSLRCFPLYSNDAETFDFRPGRYLTEAPLHPDGEWNRLRRLFDKILSADYQVTLPSAVLSHIAQPGAGQSLELTHVAQPAPVKKQGKYNISRWATSGKDDVRMNTLGHRLFKAMQASGAPLQHEDCRQLLLLWSSDLRTHVTPTRWQQAQEHLHGLAEKFSVDTSFPSKSTSQTTVSGLLAPEPHHFRVRQDRDGLFLHVESPRLRASFNLRRGLALHELSFAAHEFRPIIGTVEHGSFDSIELGADFYSVGVIVELVKEHKRVTDLAPVRAQIEYQPDGLVVSANIETSLGCIVKSFHFSIEREEVSVRIAFPGWQRPFGSMRVGNLTLVPDAAQCSSLFVETANGGFERERFPLTMNCNHAQVVNALVSCSTGFGATDGKVIIGYPQRAMQISWDPAECAMFPMLSHRIAAPSHLTRLFFSLAELDDTFRDGGSLGVVQYQLSPSE